jgi:hypothetical protein
VVKTNVLYMFHVRNMFFCPIFPYPTCFPPVSIPSGRPPFDFLTCFDPSLIAGRMGRHQHPPHDRVDSISFNVGRQTIAVPSQIASGRGARKPSPLPHALDVQTYVQFYTFARNGMRVPA